MDTISTSLPEKLPESVRPLIDETQLLPSDVSFFEQRYTSALFLKRIVIGLALFAIAAVLVLFSMEFLCERGRHIDAKYREYFNIKEFLAGAAFAYGGWLMFSSVGTGRALMRRQAAGGRTRHGIFLMTGALVSNGQFDTTVIPHENFRGLEGASLKYLLKDVPKSFTLPADWVGVSSAEVARAITLWNQAVSSATMPPLPPPPSA